MGFIELLGYISKQKYEKLLEQYGQLKSENASLARSVQTLEEDIRALKKRISDMESTSEEQSTILLLFNKFKDLKNFQAGEGIIEESVDKWMEKRWKAKKHYRELFDVENLERLTAEKFEPFLYFENNRSWTRLYRQGRQLLENMPELRTAIKHLQDESFDIETRIRDVLYGGKYHLRGFGKNTATGILHICDNEDKYGVWNRRTEEGLEAISRKPRLPSDQGVAYKRINNELVKLKEELFVDLVMIDGFMWYLSEYKDS